MFSATDYDRLHQIMEENEEIEQLLSRLLTSHQMTLSTISHEIRNPLTLVYSTLQLIESQHPEVHSFKHWSDLRQDIEYMKVLLEELSSYNNGERIRLETVDTNRFFKTLALSFATSLIDTDIQFASKIEPNLPAIQVDVVKLKECLLNLLGNAKDAVSHITPASHALISFQVHNCPDGIRILVTDNGCGISEEDLPTIFEPFVTHKQGGTGLGLAIASRVVKAHGGTIQVESIPGSGTSFSLTLPVKKHSQYKSND